MRKNDSPIFAMLPRKVLLKARLLADESIAEDRVKDMAGRRLWPLVAATVALLFLNGTNALVFSNIATDYFGGVGHWLTTSIGIYAIFIGFGGMIIMFNALVAWLEVVAFRQTNPLAPVGPENMRFYRPTTWLPLVPLSLVPALFNAWFSFGFFIAIVFLLLVLIVLFSLFSNV